MPVFRAQSSPAPANTDPTTGFCWRNNSAVWNNDADTAFILDDAGNIVHSRSY